MKKVAIAIVAVLAIAIVGYYFLAKPSEKPRLVYQVDAEKEATQSLARYVPKKVVAFYTLENLEKLWTDLRASKFWKDFTALQIWEDANVQASLQRFQDQFKANFGFDLGEGTLMDFMGQELALAILPMEAEAAQPKILFLAEVGAKTKVTERIFKIVEKIRGQGGEGEEAPSEIETIPYGSSEIVRIKATDEGEPDLYYAILGNSFILGIGDTRPAIENAIDIADGKSTDSLAQNEQYQSIIRSTTLGKNTVGRFYMDFDQVGSFVNALAAIPGGVPLAPNVANAFGALKTLGGTTVMEEGLYTRVYVIPNKEKMDDMTRKMWETKPAKPESLKLIPSGTYLYSTSCSLDIQSMWDLWLTNMKTQNPQQAQLIMDGIQNFEQTMGIEIEKDLLSWIGNEASYVFNEVSTEGLFPIPKMALLVKVKDKKSAKYFMGKLVEAVNKQAAALTQPPAAEGGAPSPLPMIAGFQLQMTEEKYKGYDVSILELPLLGKALAPGYAFVGDFLVISSNLGSLQKMIDTYKGDFPSLTEDEGFKSASLIMDRKTNQIVYANMSQMMDASIEIANWISSFQAVQPVTTPEAEANQRFIQESLIPLLKTLKSIKIIGVNTLYTPQGIEQTFFAEFQK